MPPVSQETYKKHFVITRRKNMRKHSIYHFSTVVKEKTPDERLKQEIKKSQKQ